MPLKIAGDFQFPSSKREFDSRIPHHRLAAIVGVDNPKWYTGRIMNKNVTIYSTPTCHFCDMTKNFLKENGIAYTDHDVAHDLAKRQEMIQKSGQMGVPVIFVGEEMIIGFDKERLASTLGIAA